MGAENPHKCGETMQNPQRKAPAGVKTQDVLAEATE